MVVTMAKNNQDPKKKERIDYKHNLREYWAIIGRYKGIAFLLILFGLLHEAKQIGDRYLFKVLVDKGTEFFAGNILMADFLRILFIVLFLLTFFVLVSMLSNFFRMHYLNRLDGSAMRDLKQKYFSHIVGLDHGFHTTHKTGSLISRLSRGSSALERLTDTLVFDFAPLFLQLTLSILALIYLDKFSALLIVLVMICFVLFNFSMQKISESSHVVSTKKEDIEKGNMADFLTNLDSIRYFGKEKFIRKKFFSLSSETRNAQVNNWDYYNWTSAGQSLILGIGTILILYFSMKNFIEGRITLGTLTFVYSTYIGLMGPLFSFVHGIRNFSRSMGDFQELFAYRKIESEIKDKPNSKAIKIKQGKVEFREIDFSYGKKSLFKKFNLIIPQNKKVALVGHSGCGKTSLVKLLYRLYDVQGGKIMIDGQDIRNVKQESLRSEMAIVPQECILFDDTIYNNIRFSKPNATKKEVLRAIKFAQLDKIISNFPEKENTIVGERGVKLSGGEKQRVSIARAILANKKILVLDEATSALDSETEHEIQKALEGLISGRTSLIIAHRLSTIMNSDIIVVMKKGKIIQMGTHKNLISEGGEYEKLWEFQKGGYIGG